MENIKAIWQNNFTDLFQKKTVDEINSKALKNNKLKKSLSLFQIISLGIGVIVGAGIFVLTGVAAGAHAGPAITLSFAISGLICICAGLCYAEFASILRTSGSSYSYTYVAFGRFPAWIIGSISVLGYFLGAVSVAVGWSRYFSDILSNFDINIPEKFALPMGTEYYVNGETFYALFDIPAFIITLISAFILYRGVALSAMITSFAVIIKLLALLCFISIGSFYVDTKNWIPYIPENTGNFGEYGFSGIVSGVSMVFLAFNGFDSICTSAQEVKNPQRDIPLGIIFTILSVTIIYIITAAVMTGLVPYKDLCVPQALAVAVDKIGLMWLNYVVKLGAVIGLSSVIIVSQYTVIRMLLVMAEDHLLPSIFSRVHITNKTPHILTFVVGILMSCITATINLEHIVKLSSFFILLTLIVICIATIVMRYSHTELKRSFYCPLMPITPIIAILLASYIITSYTSYIYFTASIFFIILTLIYFFQRSCFRRKIID